MVSYRGSLFNPTTSKKIKPIVIDIGLDTPEGDVLDRQIRIAEDISEATGHLAFILNFCDDHADAYYLFSKDASGCSRLDLFKIDNQDRFKLFNKYEVMKDLL